MNPTTIQNKDHKIVRFTNKAYFDFTSDMGAMYGGVPYFVPAGKSMLMPMTIGEHLATHLARQIILKKAPIRDEKEIDGKGSDRHLWDDIAINDLKSTLISEVYEEERTAPMTEAERYAAKIKELNREFPDMIASTPKLNTEQPNVNNANVVTGAEQFKAGDSGYADKSDVIAELEKRGIAFDARGNKSKLEQLLK